MIDPARLAFDVDGVLADTMTLFLDIARQEHGVTGLSLSDITCYALDECMDLPEAIIDDVVERIIDGRYSAELLPISGGPEAVGRIASAHAPVLFVTARPHPGPIKDWMKAVLPVNHGSVELVAAGAFEAKAGILKERGVQWFVEDRLETCFDLDNAGITPLVFRQPWNRKPHPFQEVGTWDEILDLIDL